ncbi:chromate transporter [Salinicola sp. MH3R3-1]|uniref:chromate transporter n=1 Tax=Salinicola sp. MH3R3-1 TaxID=1928762 RepID=UPI00094E3A83|nr:chromate transporter [Salinicola sp. MH3R3-1]OLO07740.1 chromate transporter [Salinicola sp. MH3R3-1]
MASSSLAVQGQLFMAFLRIGLLGFGGGPSMIPLVRAEAVTRYQWMNDDDFGDILAIGNTLPGPIATKMAGTIGYRVGGVAGCINAVLAVIVPCIVAMVVLLGLFTRYRDQRWIQGMSEGVVPVVMVMMAQLTWDFFQKSRAALGWIATLIMGAVAGGLIYGLGIHPGLVIAAILVAALLRPERRKRSGEVKS